MARTKQRVPLQREPSDLIQGAPDSPHDGWKLANGQAKANGVEKASGSNSIQTALAPVVQEGAGLTQLVICVGGIYASFLSWALLQERITTTTYGNDGSPERFTYSVVLNTIQSIGAALTGLVYLYLSSGRPRPAVFPSMRILPPLLLVAVTSSLASPFGYAALGHIDYITFLLAKSCKLLPVMLLHLTVFRTRYPLHKYLVVAAVTAGVAVFTLHQPSKKASIRSSGSSAWGLGLLAVNLLFDGLTNSTQDYIFASYRPYSGPQMMVAQNALASILTTLYLLLLPSLPVGLLHALAIPASSANELADAVAMLRAHPTLLHDVLGFAACGAVGQIFIYYTLATFSSLLLVTVTVTRKMLTMVLSVLCFGHRLSRIQALGVALVFAGVGAEGIVARREKAARDRQKASGQAKKLA